ncbi:MAG: amidohydrolase [Candidatus Thorarchaeota archaeon]
MSLFADLVLKNGKIVTMDSDDTISHCVAIKFERIVAVGNEKEVHPLIGPDTRVIDLDGKTAIPGLIDSHSHFMNTGSARQIFVDLSEEAGIHSIAHIQKKLKKEAENTPNGEWVFGYQEDDSKLVERRHPTRWELDAVSEDHPILVTTVGGHFWIANSKAFENAGVTKDTPDPVGGKFDRDPETGEITGGIHEKAYDILRPQGPPEPTRQQAYDGAKEILKECAAVGLTCVYDTVDRNEIRAVIDLKNHAELPIRVRMDVTIDLIEELKKLGIHRGLGDNWLRICGIKFFFDGAISARTAAVSEAYLNRPDFYGVFATTEEEAREALEDAYSQGYRISAHANGDRAIDLYLDIMEWLQAKYPQDDPRNRDIHCTVINPEIVERIKKLGVLPTIFGPYAYYHGDKLIPAFGEERLEWMFGGRSFLDADIRVAAHSDHPCAPFNPFMAIHALVNRITKNGQPIGPSQRIPVFDALKLYTTNSAYQQFDENRLGSIEPDKLADIVILSQDILTIPSDEIIDTEVVMTIIDGNIVYQPNDAE